MPRLSPTRELFLRACRAVAESPSLRDFKYAPSMNHMTRRRGDWKDTIYFQSSYRNVAGEFVQFNVGVNERDAILKKWRVRTGSHRQVDWVGGCYLGYLGEPSTYLYWNLVKGSLPEANHVIEGFAEAVADVRERLDRDARRFFGLFDDPSRLNDLAPDIWFEHVLDPANIVELFLAHGVAHQIPRFIERIGAFREPLLDAARMRLRDKRPISAQEASNGSAALALVLQKHGLLDLLSPGDA